MKFSIAIRLAAFASGFTLLASGCATTPYHRLPDEKLERIPALPVDEPQVERGRPNVVIDTVGDAFGIFGRILLANRKVDNHDVSAYTEQALLDYLAFNGLTNVKVRINQYAPRREFARLRQNKRVGAGWRYTVGVLSWAWYTVVPQRIFGGDNYNPWSDTINLYSDLKVIALHEGGHAKDFASRRYPGTYGFLYAIPFVSLYHEAMATNDALSYMREECMLNEWDRGYKTLYPAYGTYVGGNFAQYLIPYTWVYWAGVVPGHAIGRIRAAGDFPCPEETAMLSLQAKP